TCRMLSFESKLSRSWCRYPILVLRLRSTEPSDGVYCPTSSLRIVDLPVPLYPIRPIRSFGWICQVAFLIIVRAPNSKVTFCRPASMRMEVRVIYKHVSCFGSVILYLTFCLFLIFRTAKIRITGSRPFELHL